MAEANQEYCQTVLREHDEDRWLTVQYAAPARQRTLSALYAFQYEVNRIPSVVSEPPLGEIRLQWFREALGEIRAGARVRDHPVVQEIAACGLADDVYARLLDGVINAASRRLYGDEFTGFDDFLGWYERCYGAIDAAALGVCQGPAEFVEMVQRAGAYYAIAREANLRNADIVQQARENFSKSWPSLSKDLARLPAPAMPAVLALFLTPTYLKQAGKPFPMRKRLILLRAMAIGR